VRLYVEGGGSTEKLQVECRKAFRQLLEKAGLSNRMPRIYACGSRNEAYDSFRHAHATAKPGEFVVLLVDSEDPVTSPPWEHLKGQDGWNRPPSATDDQAQMMATCMETWIVADREALRRVFGSALREAHLPGVAALEVRSRDHVQDALERATAACPPARRYEKGRRSFQALAAVKPEALEELPHFQRLRVLLHDRC
jgi:hypothetical protein